jgi:hypothetical protein
LKLTKINNAIKVSVVFMMCVVLKLRQNYAIKKRKEAPLRIINQTLKCKKKTKKYTMV